MRRFRWEFLPLLMSLALVAAACSGGDDAGEAAAGDGAAGGGGSATSAEVTLTDFAIEPGDLQVAAGAPLTFHVTNEGPSPHSFAVTVGDQTYETALLDAGG